MQNRNRLTISLLQRPESRQGNGMVAPQRDQLRMFMTFGVTVAQWPTRQQLEVGGAHLVQSQGVVEWSNWDIAAIENQWP
jgi:hypothetical protein